MNTRRNTILFYIRIQRYYHGTVVQVGNNRDVSHHNARKTINCRLWIVDTGSTIQIMWSRGESNNRLANASGHFLHKDDRAFIVSDCKMHLYRIPHVWRLSVVELIITELRGTCGRNCSGDKLFCYTSRDVTMTRVVRIGVSSVV